MSRTAKRTKRISIPSLPFSQRRASEISSEVEYQISDGSTISEIDKATYDSLESFISAL